LFKLSQVEPDIYRITGVVMLPHLVDIGKPEQVKVVDSVLVLARWSVSPASCEGQMTDRLDFEINVELETRQITGHAGAPGLIETFRHCVLRPPRPGGRCPRIESQSAALAARDGAVNALHFHS
jgi:hypothetical protein